MRLEETILFHGAEFVEQPGQNQIRNVLMLGPESSHGYGYEQEAMARAVQKGLYEGCRIFINHSKEGRDLKDLAGVFRNTRHEGGRIRGDAHLLLNGPGKLFWEIAKNMPEAASCSHVADGRLVTKNGKKVVEEISKVYSVDLVVQGATTRSVFEGDSPNDLTPKPDETEEQFCVRYIRETKGNMTSEKSWEQALAVWNGEGDPEPAAAPRNLSDTPAAEHADPEPSATDVKIAAYNALVERGDRYFAEQHRKTFGQERKSDMETLEQRIDRRIAEVNLIRERLERLVDPAVEDIVVEETAVEEQTAYEERCRQREENHRLAEQIAPMLTLDPIKEANICEEAAEERSRERERQRREEDQTHRDAERIAEAALAGAQLTE